MASTYASSRVHEVEHRSTSACKFGTGNVRITSDGWDDIEPDEYALEPPPAADIPSVCLQDGTTIRVAPMERKCGGWDEEHFHDQLKLPDGVNVAKGIVVTFEARARECIAIALSPTPFFTLGKTYAIHFGAAGDLSTVLRRRLPNETEAVDATFPSRVCTDDKWTSYWVCLQSGKLSAGVGKIPGKQCIGTLDDTLYNQLRSGVDAVRYVGLGNSALSRNARDLKFRKVRVTGIPSAFGATGVVMEELRDDDGVGFISVRSSDTSGGIENAGSSDAELLAEYERECAKARARAAKFGTEYREPKPDAFLKWSEARRLRANPERGFITGMDVTSQEELDKQRARKERFESDERKRKTRSGDGEEEAMEDEGDRESDGMEDMDEGNAKREPLPVEQAWDNEELVREHRTDPPKTLFPKRSDDANGAHDSMEKENGNVKESSTDVKDAYGSTAATDAVLVPEKIHLCAIDWAAFKQIRTDDVMAFFAVFGPSYVEWLGELSCNILFEDKFSAARALASLSQELPSPPPEALVPSSDMCEESNKTSTPSDLGQMGWRFCKLPLRKVANDRYGRRGTRSRVLMRIASSFDVLVERPTAWPAPPPGFTTKRVLGPGSDFDTRHRRSKGDGKRRKRSGGNRRENEEVGNYVDGEEEKNADEHPALSRGLRSGRSGFSVEEMEAERAAKRALAEPKS